ncbi:unannotated protein [freshwater metagenome]|uniref:Unannotated protein n=1 Tax=freshwater metagenome TaxID=449393 RepID=A0A6J6H451_9ZZZZ
MSVLRYRRSRRSFAWRWNELMHGLFAHKVLTIVPISLCSESCKAVPTAPCVQKARNVLSMLDSMVMPLADYRWARAAQRWWKQLVHVSETFLSTSRDISWEWVTLLRSLRLSNSGSISSTVFCKLALVVMEPHSHRKENCIQRMHSS